MDTVLHVWFQVVNLATHSLHIFVLDVRMSIYLWMEFVNVAKQMWG